MFYLPYFTKIYHTEHIPFHYVMMVGYDDVPAELYQYTNTIFIGQII